MKYSALADEQNYLNGLYARLDDLRASTQTRLDEARRSPVSNEQELSQRDATAHTHRRRLATLDAAEEGLCFGRLDFDDEEKPQYLGRIGMRSEQGEPMLVDWRAPAGRRFYLATATNPDGVRRRRHLHTRGRKLTGVSDEILDLDAPRDSTHEHLGAQGALLAAIDASRTDKMRDIVATIQAEQDNIIRSPLEGTLVVDGAPGTGKTAVALHRAAYLLYEYREQLSRRGVLIVGPNTTFLDYISEVLPGLAETDVLLRTPGQLFPGVDAHGEESDRVAAIKGEARMARAMAQAVEDRQEIPVEPIELYYETHTLWLRPEAVRQARQAARATELPHNQARATFVAHLREDLCDQYADIIGADPLGGDNLLSRADREDLLEEITSEEDISAAIEELWPRLTPQRLLSDLYSSPQRLAAACEHLSQEERALLEREPHSPWSEADIALLDEVANVLDSDEDDAEGPQLSDEQIAYAQGVLDIVTGSASYDFEDELESEIIMATDVLDAAIFGERHRHNEFATVAERAASDRRWVFGHIIVDEAQELSPMMWRALRRRCVSQSFTVAGDLAQATSHHVRTWADVFGNRNHLWRRERLTVSYRTPEEILRVTASVLAAINAEAPVPNAVRSAGHEPWLEAVADDQLDARLREVIEAERAAVGEGTVGVITSSTYLRRLQELSSPPSAPDHPDSQAVRVLSVRQAKGLEFDSVLLVDPNGIMDNGTGHRDLYVALTRSTQRLGLLHVGQGGPDFPGVEQIGERNR
ncbi:AAA family ATPase [Natronoglycomyces albus]|uniref:AAA family ATPase n=1 Tax=Natronoglycomyces albus TaxID=2811108 RepID=A0A895XP98_9ACTN|nr:AAA family ATPase [Natronoglycomyces albus]